MKLSKGLKGVELSKFLKQFGKEHPEYSLSYNTFKKRQGEYLEEGLKAFIPINIKRTRCKRVDIDVYNYFKKLYLHPRKFSVIQCIDIIKADEKFKNIQVPDRNH